MEYIDATTTTGDGSGARKAFLRVSAHVDYMYMLHGHDIHGTVILEGAARNSPPT